MTIVLLYNSTIAVILPEQQAALAVQRENAKRREEEVDGSIFATAARTFWQ